MRRIKRFTVIPLICLLLFALTGCGGMESYGSANTQNAVQTQNVRQETEETEAQTSEDTIASEDSAGSAGITEAEEHVRTVENETPEQASSGSDILVVYFSRIGEQYGVGVIEEGNTAIVARMIAEQTGADTFELLPVDDHYPLVYDELTDVAKREQNENARPEYAGEVPDLSQYSIIFIGAPVWWGDWPMICYTFFENESLSGKTLYPFSTHAGSGLSGFDKKLSSAVSDASVGKGFSVAGTDCQNDQDGVRNKVNAWLSELGY